MKNSETFEIEKQHEIEKLEEHNSFLEKLINSNNQVTIFNSKEISKLKVLLEKNNKYLHKLKSNEFEIAIVGLEKAGKSTFANALIGNDVLPSAPERCTFTSTRLTYGDDNAIVEFYTEEEFNNIFIELLKDIEYPNFEKENFKTISLEKFNSFFDALEYNNFSLYKTHVGKTDEEIKDIISCRDALTLTGSTKTFSGDELLNESFQSYIKGENKGEDTSKPRSVKRVEISSSKLEKLDTAIIYDVPGFDSPTKIHERQTIERLKNADAIILVTNVGRNPSLVGTQLNIITKNSDSDGIPLRDKLFVFGNQLDTANSEEEAQGNIITLQKNVAKYKIGEQKRVFTGSALKYLVQDKKIISKNDYKLNYEFDSGIDKIYSELIYYYENERFEILKRKIDSNKREFTEILKEIIEKSDMDYDVNFAENEKQKIIRETYQEIETNLKKKLKQLKYNLKKEIWEDRYFSNKFKEEVQNLNYFQNIDEETITSARINEDESLTLDTPIEKMNQYIRKNLHKKFLQEFSTLVKQMTDEKSRDIELRILRTFTTSILSDTNSIDFDLIEKESEKLIKKLTKDILHNDGRFVYLIERFSRDILDILISTPLFTQDRRDKFEKASVEFSYLDNYYNNGNGSLVSILLTGEKKNNLEDLVALANTIVSWSSSQAKLIAKSQEILKIGKKIVKLSKKDTRFDIDEILKDKTKSKTETEVLDEINRDIENLKDILSKAVTPAISLETAFLNSIDKQIKILIDSLESEKSENSNIFNDFITKIVPKIKNEELKNINQKLKEYQLKKELLDEIKKYI